MSRQYMRACKHCQKPTLHVGPETSHLLHLVLSFVTLGIWTIPWILITASNNLSGQCTVCGRKRTLFL